MHSEFSFNCAPTNGNAGTIPIERINGISAKIIIFIKSKILKLHLNELFFYTFTIFKIDINLMNVSKVNCCSYIFFINFILLKKGFDFHFYGWVTVFRRSWRRPNRRMRRLWLGRIWLGGLVSFDREGLGEVGFRWRPRDAPTGSIRHGG